MLRTCEVGGGGAFKNLGGGGGSKNNGQINVLYNMKYLSILNHLVQLPRSCLGEGEGKFRG